MKGLTKILFKVFSVASVMVLACTPNVLAEKMELATDTLKIYGIGQQTTSDKTFVFKGNSKMPQKVHITELSLTYEGKEKKPSQLSIVEVKGDTLFSSSVTNGLFPDELKESVRLYLLNGKSYVITHGENKWNLNFDGVKPTQSEVNDTIIPSMAKSLGIPQWRIDEGFNIPEGASGEEISEHLNLISKNLCDNAKSNIPWWIYLIIAILGLTCVFLLLPSLKKVLPKKPGQPTQKQSEDISDNNMLTPAGDSSSKAENTAVDNEDGVNQETTLIALREKISSLLTNDYDNEFSDEQKIAKINSLLESGREAIEGLRLVRHKLNIEDENVVPYFLCEKIDELKNNSSTVSQETYERIQGEICSKFIEELLRKNNKILSDIVADAKNEKRTNPYEKLLKIIDLLLYRVKVEKIASADAAQSEPIEITDDQLKRTDNQYVLKKWLCEQLKAVDITGFDMNKTAHDNLYKISEQLKKSQEDAPRKSDEEIVDGIILDDKLTEEQKKVLIRRLIDIINRKIIDSSKSINVSLSLFEFTQSVADALQQPNSHEEAQTQTQQRDILIVNEALGTDMTSLSKEAIKEAVKRFVLSLLQSKLSNVSINSYEDALMSLTTCNERHKVIEKLLNEFDAEKLVDLPGAIRKKQNNDLFNSISGKVAELLPGQHFDSIQKLVNALFSEVKDARENRELIADELEEKISLRDKTYISNEGNRDVLKLMSLYGNLVKDSDDERCDQIAKKDAEIRSLNGTISSKEQTISSLENDNQTLMSESSKLVEELHGGAELILESCKTILNPCSDDEEAQCVDIEDRLFADLSSSIGRMKSFTAEKNTIPSDTRKSIQKLLVNELSSENSAINTVCRYYAYSRLPFMTDTSRQYGITFNRKNMFELYDAIENLYVHFGINLNVPSLFVMGIEEGTFENVTGKMYGDLDNLCQNSRNHFDKIDSATKPSNVIVDVVNVGYSVDGQVGRITSVLTY